MAAVAAVLYLLHDLLVDFGRVVPSVLGGLGVLGGVEDLDGGFGVDASAHEMLSLLLLSFEDLWLNLTHIELANTIVKF